MDAKEITQGLYNILENTNAQSKQDAGIDLVYFPLDNKFFILGEDLELYQITITHAPKQALLDMRKEKRARGLA